MDAEGYDEFGLFHENAEEYGLRYTSPPVVRRAAVELEDGRHLSGLVWGEREPELVFLHGGAQNAHTWDTVAMALDRPLLAVDLPGHGQSEGGRGGSLSPTSNAADVAVTIRQLAPRAKAVIGMSLGGLTAIALCREAPELVSRLVLVDITPGVNAEKSSQITAFVQGPETFSTFEEIMARTVQFNPTRSVSSPASGHPPQRRPEARRELGVEVQTVRDRSRPLVRGFRHAVGRGVEAEAPIMLVRGMLPQSVVDDADEAELLRRRPDARVERVENAGHSVQGDAPLELAQLIADFAS